MIVTTQCARVIFAFTDWVEMNKFMFRRRVILARTIVETPF